MAKKKNDKTIPPIEPENGAKAAENADVNAGAENAAAAEELPETITLTREEFMKVKAKLDQLEKEKNDNTALLQRLQADFDNYRKRNATLSMDSLDEGARNVIKALLPVLDNFERAMGAAPEGSWADGVKLVQKQLFGILEKNGLEEIEASGAFDPEFHEAVLQEEAEGKESGDIVEVLQKGYKVKNRIIRHSMVKVAK